MPNFKLAPGNFRSARTSSAGSRASPPDWMYPDAERQLATWISAGGWVHCLVRACSIFTKIRMIFSDSRSLLPVRLYAAVACTGLFRGNQTPTDGREQINARSRRALGLLLVSATLQSNSGWSTAQMADRTLGHCRKRRTICCCRMQSVVVDREFRPMTPLLTSPDILRRPDIASLPELCPLDEPAVKVLACRCRLHSLRTIHR